METPREAGDRAVREPVVSLDDLLRGLLWPLLLRGPALALRPERWVLGVAAVVIIGLIGSISGAWAEEGEPPFGRAVVTHVAGPVGDMVDATLPWRWHPQVFRAAVVNMMYAPARVLDAHPLSVVVLGIPMLLVWCVFGLAIARSTACEVSLARVVRGTDALAFGLRRWISGFGAVAAPLLAIGLIHLVIASGGFLLLTWPVGDVVGAVMHVFGIALAVGAVLIGLGFVLGWIMLVPALACEGTDGLDAVQRVFAYVLGRPLRLLVYLVVVGLVGAVAFAIITWVREFAVIMANGAAGQWSGERGDTILKATAETGTAGAAAAIIGLWKALLDVAIAGFVVSYVHTAGTLVYLLCRRINDGQEIAELWTEDGR